MLQKNQAVCWNYFILICIVLNVIQNYKQQQLVSLPETADNEQTGGMFHRKTSYNGTKWIDTSPVVLTNTFTNYD